MASEQPESKDEQRNQQAMEQLTLPSPAPGKPPWTCILSSPHDRVRLEARVSALWELMSWRGDILSSCVPDIKECGPYSRVSCGVYLDCEDFMESYCMCSPGYRPVSEAMFHIDPHEPCDGKKNPVSSFSSFIRFGILNPFSRPSGG